MRSTNTHAYAMLIGSMLIFSTIGIFRRYIEMPSAALACARGLLGAFFLCLLILLTRKKLAKISFKNLMIYILCGGFLGTNWMLLFEAYNRTTVATATMCYYMEPTIVIALSALIFHERLTLKSIMCAIISLAGMALVCGITEQNGFRSDSDGILFGLSAAFFYAGVVILNKLSPSDDIYGKTVIQLFSAAAILLPYVLLTEGAAAFHLDGFSWLMVLFVGIVHTGIAYALYFGSLPYLKAQSIALLSYIDPVGALILSSIILHESMTPEGMFGAVLIIGAAIANEISLPKRQNRR